MPNRLILILAAVMLGGSASGQITRKEVVKATTDKDDAKGLSPDVPESFAVSTQFERVIVIRFKNQSDLLAGIEKHVREQRITNAVILSGIGSAISTHHHVVSNRTFPSKNLFIENPTASADIVTFSGLVLGGRVHAHIAFADGEKMYGGHLEPRNRVFTFAIVTIGVLPSNLDMSRFDDKSYR